MNGFRCSMSGSMRRSDIFPSRPATRPSGKSGGRTQRMSNCISLWAKTTSHSTRWDSFANLGVSSIQIPSLCTTLLNKLQYILLPPFLNIIPFRDFNMDYTLKYVYIHPYVVRIEISKRAYISRRREYMCKCIQICSRQFLYYLFIEILFCCICNNFTGHVSLCSTWYWWKLDSDEEY